MKSRMFLLLVNENSTVFTLVNEKSIVFTFIAGKIC